eukprot:PRCOL_00003812-RA
MVQRACAAGRAASAASAGGRGRPLPRRARCRAAAAQAQGPHEVLGVDYGASREELRAAFRRLVRTQHPDVVAARSGEQAQRQANARFIEILGAYEALMGDGRRGDWLSELDIDAPRWTVNGGRHKGRWRSEEIEFYPMEPTIENRAYDTRSDAEMQAAASAWMAHQEERARAKEEREAALRAQRDAQRARARQAQARQSSSAGDGMMMAFVGLAAFMAVSTSSGMPASGNDSRPAGMPAAGECRERGGGLCRFL